MRDFRTAVVALIVSLLGTRLYPWIVRTDDEDDFDVWTQFSCGRIVKRFDAATTVTTAAHRRVPVLLESSDLTARWPSAWTEETIAASVPFLREVKRASIEAGHSTSAPPMLWISS